MKVEILLVNMNSFSIEFENTFDIDELIREEVDIQKSESISRGFLNLIGLKTSGLKFNIIEQDRFIRFILSKLFKGYEVINTNRKELGHPDLILEKKIEGVVSERSDKIYVELKIGSDTLRKSQIKWFIDNKEKNNKLLFISYDTDAESDENRFGLL